MNSTLAHRKAEIRLEDDALVRGAVRSTVERLARLARYPDFQMLVSGSPDMGIAKTRLVWVPRPLPASGG